jgi:hypothetical protein
MANALAAFLEQFSDISDIKRITTGRSVTK